MANMGLGELASGNICFKRKYRWLFFIDGVSGDGVDALPPQRSARPSLSFKEMEFQHVNETIYYPAKSDWRPINLTLYDITRVKHPVFQWVQNIYNPCREERAWTPVVDSNFKKEGRLTLLNGCGDIIETWVYDNIWPLSVEFGELDMSNSEVVTCDLSLRYDRAYVLDNCSSSNAITR